MQKILIEVNKSNGNNLMQSFGSDSAVNQIARSLDSKHVVEPVKKLRKNVLNRERKVSKFPSVTVSSDCNKSLLDEYQGRGVTVNNVLLENFGNVAVNI